MEKLGRRVESFTADVRDFEVLREGLDRAVESVGRLDVLVANA